MESLERNPETVAKRSGRRLAVPLPVIGGVLAFALGWVAGLDRTAAAEALNLGTFASPIVVDLDGNGVATTEVEVVFDIDADGRPDRLRDIAPADGVLVFDADKDGMPGESGRELLGDRADIDGDGRFDQVSDGFEALASLVLEASHRGWISEESLRTGLLGAAELKALESGFGLRVRLGGLRGQDLTFHEAGIASLRLSTAPSRRRLDFDGAGNDLAERHGAVALRHNGTPASYADVWLRFRSALLPQAALTAAR